MTYMPTQSVQQRALTIATAIAALPDDAPEIAVLDLFGPGDLAVFVFLDTKPGADVFYDLRTEGYAYGAWFARLRQVRNNAANDLFARMDAR